MRLGLRPPVRRTAPEARHRFAHGPAAHGRDRTTRDARLGEIHGGDGHRSGPIPPRALRARRGAAQPDDRRTARGDDRRRGRPPGRQTGEVLEEGFAPHRRPARPRPQGPSPTAGGVGRDERPAPSPLRRQAAQGRRLRRPRPLLRARRRRGLRRTSRRRAHPPSRRDRRVRREGPPHARSSGAGRR